MQIVQTPDDLAALRDSDPEAYRSQLEEIIGSSVIRMNAAEYPEDYDSALTLGDPGYVAAQWVRVADTSTLTRLGFADLAAVEQALAALD
jgi:hypothetical protein